MLRHSYSTRLHHHLVKVSILSFVRLKRVFRLLRNRFLGVLREWRWVEFIWVVLFVPLGALFLRQSVVTTRCIWILIFLMYFFKNRVPLGRWVVHHTLSHLLLLPSLFSNLHVHLHEVVLIHDPTLEYLLHTAAPWFLPRRFRVIWPLILLHWRRHPWTTLNRPQILTVYAATNRQLLHGMLRLMHRNSITLVHLNLELFKLDLNLLQRLFVVIHHFLHFWLPFDQRL